MIAKHILHSQQCIRLQYAPQESCQKLTPKWSKKAQ